MITAWIDIKLTLKQKLKILFSRKQRLIFSNCEIKIADDYLRIQRWNNIGICEDCGKEYPKKQSRMRFCNECRKHLGGGK